MEEVWEVFLWRMSARESPSCQWLSHKTPSFNSCWFKFHLFCWPIFFFAEGCIIATKSLYTWWWTLLLPNTANNVSLVKRLWCMPKLESVNIKGLTNNNKPSDLYVPPTHVLRNTQKCSSLRHSHVSVFRVRLAVGLTKTKVALRILQMWER